MKQFKKNTVHTTKKKCMQKTNESAFDKFITHENCYDMKSDSNFTLHDFIGNVCLDAKHAFIAGSRQYDTLFDSIWVLHACQDIIISYNFDDRCVELLYDALKDTRMHDDMQCKCTSKQQLHWIFTQLKYVYENINLSVMNAAGFNAIYSKFDYALFALFVNGFMHKSRKHFYDEMMKCLNEYVINHGEYLTVIDKIYSKTSHFLETYNLHYNHPHNKDGECCCTSCACNKKQFTGNLNSTCCNDTIKNCGNQLDDTQYSQHTYFNEFINLLHIINKKIDYLVGSIRNKNR